ncbi:hypothetical protein PoB_003544800 [Plakobranchus ocellatus]|uniref:C-type lectin domain-containing protein n=1 Tax=Plakobranchus ocellatus TaxID=259542 RepID=A0AAV4AQ48_9GAST|nr:hypothetical protein PoB_003544800 [Plakobranchus ocellatus]
MQLPYVIITMSTASLIISGICSVRLTSYSLQNSFSIIYEELNFTEAEKTCKALGYDGLAIPSSPEEFAYVLEATAYARQRIGEWLALRYYPEVDSILWDDGTAPAPDMPWFVRQSYRDPRYPCGRIYVAGVLGMIKCSALRYAVCGNHVKPYVEAHGETHTSFAPDILTPSLSEFKVESYLECSIHCGRIHLCRFAHFHHVTKICKILGPELQSSLAEDPESTTFVRRSYL